MQSLGKGLPKHSRGAAGAPLGADGLIGELAGEYRILRKLGAGGFGTVYEAEHPVLKRRAAVKVLHENRSLDDVGIQRFLAEARAASQIQHRHIVDIFSYGRLPNGQLFYVMDLLQGAPLDAYLREHGVLGPELALATLWPIARALDALHAAGVIHRDVKPANIFLAWESSGEVVPKLLDFGLIKLLGDSPITTASDVLMGTPYYMAPEQCRGLDVDARTDVYSLGVIVHELCTGTVPFVKDSASAVLLDHVLTPAPRMSESRPQLSATLDAPVLAMLAKAPAERPASASAALEQLERSLHAAGMQVLTPPLQLPRPQTKPAPATTPEGEFDVAYSGSASGIKRTRGASLLAWGLLVLGVIAGVLLVARMGSRQQLQAPVAVTPVVEPAAPVAEKAVAEKAKVELSPAAAQPAAPALVRLRLHVVPPSAQVRIGDRGPLPVSAPLELTRSDSEIVLSLEARGYEPKTLRIVPDRDLELEATLRAAAPRPTKRVSRDLENPF